MPGAALPDDDAPDLCPVCVEVLDGSSPQAELPGCGHTFHVACLVNCAQYDARCPVCRQVGDGIALRAAAAPQPPPPPRPARTEVITIDLDLDDEVAEVQREWRRYAQRRRRVLRTRPVLSEKVLRLRALRAAFNRACDDTQRMYDRKCREVWRGDAELIAQRGEMTRARRRERRLERIVEEELAQLLGPEPMWGDLE